MRRRVFTKFWTGHGARGGTGLGLYLVNGIARAHGGQVTILDAPGGGARIVMDWPGQTRLLTADLHKTFTSHAPVGHAFAPTLAAWDPARVLVVEDEPSSTRRWPTGCGPRGSRVDQAYDGPGAVGGTPPRGPTSSSST